MFMFLGSMRMLQIAMIILSVLSISPILWRQSLLAGLRIIRILLEQMQSMFLVNMHM